jgi:predicted Zn-ribbon and HTH transcriptional regulator
MEQENITEKLISLLDGTLSAAESAELQQWIEMNPDIKKQYQELKEILKPFDAVQPTVPSDRMTRRYQDFLAKESHVQPRFLSLDRSFLRIAAGILLMLTTGIGLWTVNRYIRQQQELELVRLELEKTKSLIMDQVKDPLSASQRMQAMHTSLQMEAPDDDILNVLIHTFNEDPNSNVRMAALEALQKFYLHPIVRESLILSMKNQKDPVVQIALIQLLVQMKEKSILQDLQKITEQPATLKAVKDEAYQAIFKLT